MGTSLRKEKAKNIGKRTFGTLIIPVLFIGTLLIICAANGREIFPTSTSFSNFVISAAITTITTIALSINLNSGRFDFSLGSMAVLSVIISAKISQAILKGGSGTAPFILVFSCLFGAVIGLVSGIIYVLLKIPPIITSLGMTLIFEGVSYTITQGSYLTSEVRNDSISAFNNGWYYSLLVLAVVIGFVIYLFDYTKFGFNYKVLKEGQKVAVHSGIKEIPNAIGCYAICGALMGIVGFLSAARSTLVNGGSLNFGSISIMFTAFLPMFIGAFIGRYSNDKLGYLLAGICMAFLNSLFAVFSNELNSSTQSIINSLLLVFFLIYLNNENTLKSFFAEKFSKKKVEA